MSAFQVQKIRSCVQCGTVLSLKCKACTAHPERKPKVIVLYDWPKILETCPSGHCIRIVCQRPGCTKTMWRLLKTAKGGKSIYEESFCSRQCNVLVRAAEKNSKIMVKCGWHGCSIKVPRKPSEIKKMKRAFCRPDHYFLTMRKDIHDAREAAKAALDSGNVGLLHCPKCNDVTEHETPSTSSAICKICRSARFAPTSSLGSGETARIKAADRAVLAGVRN